MSGSMGSVWAAAIEGFNDYVQQLQAHPDADTTRFSLTCFDTISEKWHTDIPVSEMPVVTSERYIPRGGTALYDAIAETVTDADAHLVGDRADERVLVVILSDGFENSSKEYKSYPETSGSVLGDNGRQRLAALVKAYEAKGNWTFMYLGANDPQVKQTAQDMGIQGGNAAYYTSEASSLKGVTSSLGQVTHSRKFSPAGQTSTSFQDAGVTDDYRTTDAPNPPYVPPVQQPSDASKQAEIKKQGIDGLLGD